MFDLCIHIGVIYWISVFMLVPFWDLCIHVGVMFRLVFSYWCRFYIRVVMSGSHLNWCIHLGVVLGSVYSLLMFVWDMRTQVGVMFRCLYSCSFVYPF